MADLNQRLMKYNEETFFGQWRLDGATPDAALLGKGSFGRVYSVYREERDSSGHMSRYTAAIKVIPIEEATCIRAKDADRDKEWKQSVLNKELKVVQREIEIMRKLEGESNIAYFQNSRIVRRTDTELECWDVLICMEKLQVLRKNLKELGLTPGSHQYLMRVLYIWKEMGAALRVCEKNSILHTDIKPDNVFYAPGPDHYKLSDFGTSIVANTFKEGIFHGTYEYVAPEMYHRQGGDSRVDMYSLAVMIYELLNNNELPLQQGNNREAAWKARLEALKPVPPLKNVPQDVNAVLLRCLDADPKRRYASCSDLADVTTELYLRHKTGPGPKPFPKWIIPVAACVVAIGALGAGMAAMLAPDENDQIDLRPTMPVETAVIPMMELQLGDQGEIVFMPGFSITVNGQFKVIQGDIDVNNLVLYVDGKEWDMSCWQDGDAYTFFSDMQIEGAGQFDKQVGIRQRGAVSDIATGSVKFTEVNLAGGMGAQPTDAPTSEPTGTPEPTNEPTATPAPSMELVIDAGQIEVQDGMVFVEGTVNVTGEVQTEDLVVSINGTAVQSVWNAADGGYSFTAMADMDVSAADSLEIKVSPTGGDIEPAVCIVEIEKPAATEIVYSPISVNGIEELYGKWVGMEQTLTLSGTAHPGAELTAQVGGNTAASCKADADGAFEMTISSDSFSEGENIIDVTYAAAGQAMETVSFAIRHDAAKPEFEVQDQIDQFTDQLEIRITDMDTECRAKLMIDGMLIQEATANGGVVSMYGITNIPLTAATRIEIVVEDSAGNAASKTIAYRRQLGEITVNNADELASAPAVSGMSRQVTGMADPNVSLRIQLGDKNWTVNTDFIGSYSWKVDEGALSDGANKFFIEYAAVDGVPVESGSGRVEFTVLHDGAAPVVTVTPASIMQGTRELTIRVEGESEWMAGLLVDDVMVQATDMQTGSECLMQIPDTVKITAQSKIVVMVTDSADNTTFVELEAAAVSPITIVNAADASATRWGSSNSVRLQLKGEPGANMCVLNGDRSLDVQTAEGEATADVTKLLASGVNNLIVQYAADSGYSGDVLSSTQAVIPITYDPDCPEAQVTPSVINVSTKELTVNVSNEPYGYGVYLLADGDIVWTQDDVQGDTVKITGVQELGLANAQEVSVLVTDYLNEAVECRLGVDSSTELDAFAFSQGNYVWRCKAGEYGQANCYVVCNQSDMNYENMTVRLVAEDGTSRECRWWFGVTDGEHRLWADIMIASGEINVTAYDYLESSSGLSDYADSVYTIIWDVPVSLSDGVYTLEISINASGKQYTYKVCDVVLEEQPDVSRVSDDDVNVNIDREKSYAISFDNPILSAFRPDSVVLTGYVFHTSDKPAYFDRYEVLDINGQLIYTGYISSENFTQYARKMKDTIPITGVQGDKSDAGFVLDIDLSGLGLTTGDRCEVQLYSSNVVGVGKPTVSAMIVIDENAPVITEQDIKEIVASW